MGSGSFVVFFFFAGRQSHSPNTTSDEVLQIRHRMIKWDLQFLHYFQRSDLLPSESHFAFQEFRDSYVPPEAVCFLLLAPRPTPSAGVLVVLPAPAAFRFHPAQADAGCRVSTSSQGAFNGTHRWGNGPAVQSAESAEAKKIRRLLGKNTTLKPSACKCSRQVANTNVTKTELCSRTSSETLPLFPSPPSH